MAIVNPVSSGLPSVTVTENCCPFIAARSSTDNATRECPCTRIRDPGRTNRSPCSAMIFLARFDVSANVLPRSISFRLATSKLSASSALVRVVYRRNSSQPVCRLIAVGLYRCNACAPSLISRSNPIIVVLVLLLITVVRAWIAATATAMSDDLANAS